MLDALTWVSPDGSTIEFADLSDGIGVEPGLEGRFAPPPHIVADVLAGSDGSRVRNVRYGVREIAIPLSIEADSPDDLHTSLRDLVSRLDPKRGVGKLRATGAGGTTREIACRYGGGLEIVEDIATSVTGWARASIVLVAHDPLWQDMSPTVETVGVEATAFLSPDASTAWFPWSLVESDAVGGFTVNNDGDDDAWPQWTIQGPGAGLLKLSNLATGETIEIANVSMVSGEKITIDTRPGYKTVTGPSGENLWPDLSDGSDLWPLERGTQTVTVTLAGAVAGESNVRLEWRRKWLTV